MLYCEVRADGIEAAALATKTERLGAAQKENDEATNPWHAIAQGHYTKHEACAGLARTACEK